jgi:hypothetical protein
MSIDRRQFLRASTVMAAATVGVVACDAGDDTRSLARPDILPAIGAAAVRDIGRRYRQMVPEERDASTLRAAILEDRSRLSRFAWLTRPDVADLIRADFMNARVVLVNGWVLSRTEARQCALFDMQS